MEDRDFDQLARESAEAPTRRTVVRGLAAVLGAAGIGLGLSLEAEAKKSKKKKRRQKQKRKQKKKEKQQECNDKGKVCATPTNPCKTVACESNKCVTSNAANGAACGTGLACDAGQCVAATCTADATCGPNGCSCTQPGRQQVPGTGFCQATTFSQSFANNADGWFAMLDSDNTWYPPGTDNTIVIDNGHAVLQAANAYNPEFDKTAMSPLGGRTAKFPAGGWDVSLDIFLDLDNLTANERFSYSAAADNTSCEHLRDFIFHVGVNGAGTAICAAANNNAGPGVQDVCAMANAVNLTTAGLETGWYSFEHRFRNQSGALSVAMEITDLDNGDGSVFDQDLATADPIGSTGGVRYAFFPFNNYAGGVQIRNSERVNRD